VQIGSWFSEQSATHLVLEFLSEKPDSTNTAIMGKIAWGRIINHIWILRLEI
jgi:hypothetical protein